MGFKINKLNKFFMTILFFFLLSFNSSIVIASTYYADITIDIDTSGFVTINGVTNHPDLLAENTEIYTSKKQSYWLFNITKNEIFSDYIFMLTLPDHSSINYIKSSGSIRIEEETGNLIIRGFGQNESFSLIVQYQVKKNSDTIGLMDINTILIIIGLIFIFVIILLIISYITKKKYFITNENSTKERKQYNLSGLTYRQKKIMELLIEQNRPLTQTEIQQELNIPKAAVSRNINSLEIKGLVEKEKIGMSNLIKIKKP